MKGPLLLFLLLFALNFGCASVTSGSNLTSIVVETPPLASTASGDVATVTRLPNLTPTLTPRPSASFTPTGTPLPALTSTPTPTLTPRPSASFTPTGTPLPTLTSTPIPLPSPTPSPTQSPTLAPTTIPPTAPNPGDPAQVERGFEIYKQQYCGLCHQLDAAGTAGQFGPSHNGIGTKAEQRIREAQYGGPALTAAEYIHESIVSPKVYLVAGYENTQHQMPAYVHLSEADVDALVQMLLQQK